MFFFISTVTVLSIVADMSQQIVHSPKEQSDQGLH